LADVASAVEGGSGDPESGAASEGELDGELDGEDAIEGLGNTDRLAFRDTPPGAHARQERDIAPTDRARGQARIDAAEVQRRVAKALQKKNRTRTNTKTNKNKQTDKRDRRDQAKGGGEF